MLTDLTDGIEFVKQDLVELALANTISENIVEYNTKIIPIETLEPEPLLNFGYSLYL